MDFTSTQQPAQPQKGLSKEYIEFLLEEQKFREANTFYEKLCKMAEQLRIKPPKGLEEKLKFDIVFAGLNVSPTGVLSAAFLSTLLLFTPFIILSFIPTIDSSTLILFAILPFVAFWYVYTYPSFLSQVVRIQAGDEAIKIILYMVIYLKLNPSFEGAVNFALSHSKGPMTQDIKKAMWDLEIGKYKTVEEALSTYMVKWSAWNEDFIRSLSLLYGVLIEPTEQGREGILRKSLSFILESTHLKMKKYVEEVSSPIMLLHVMGLLLPAVGLIMFPMISIFLNQQVSVPQLIMGYIVFLPLLNLFFIYRILMKRPSAFVVPDISRHPELPSEEFFTLKFGSLKVNVPIFLLAILAGVLVMIYGIFHFVDLASSLITAPTDAVKEEILQKEATINSVNLISTFSITGGAATIFILYFYLRSFQRIRIRNEIKNIEQEFQIGLFSLGNFLAEGYPIEVAMEKSLEEYRKLGMQKRPMYSFFQRLFFNIKNFGMTFKKSLFDSQYGILIYYPSVLIDDIMRILSDASEKSAVLLGTIAKTIATYLENIYAVEAKIRELLEDTRSSIKLQASFVVPLITAVVGALGLFIINTLRLLAEKLAEIEKALNFTFFSSSANAASGFIGVLIGSFQKVVPLTVLQAVVGIYTVEVVALFAMLLSGIENGFDRVARDYEIAQTLIKAILVYGAVSVAALIVFNGITATIKGV